MADGGASLGYEGDSYTLQGAGLYISKCKNPSVYCDLDKAGSKWGYWLSNPATVANGSYMWSVYNEEGRIISANTRYYAVGNNGYGVNDLLGFRPVIALDSSVVFTDSVNGTYQMN